MYQKSLTRTVRSGKWLSTLLFLPLLLMAQSGVQAQEEEEQEKVCSTVTICPTGGEAECRTVEVCGEEWAGDTERLAELIERLTSRAQGLQEMGRLRARELERLYREQAERTRALDRDRLQELSEEARARAEHMHQLQEEEARALAEELRVQREHLQEEQSVRARELAEEIRARSEHLHQLEAERARELAAEYRARAEQMHEEQAARAQEMAERYRELGEEFQERWGQVIWMRSGARIGITLSGSQDPDLDLQGAEVTGVMDDSPAEEAGLEEGDIITHINGHSLLDPIPDEDSMRDDWGDGSLPVNRLIALARELEPGAEVEIRYLREGDSHTVSLEAAEVGSRNFYIGGFPGGATGRFYQWDPGERGEWNFRFDPEAFEGLRWHFEGDSLRGLLFDREGAWREFPFPEGRLEGILEGDLLRGTYLDMESCGEGVFFGNCVAGLELRELNEGLGGYFGTTEGVLVLSVAQDSELGLEAGDVIQAIGDREVGQPSDVRRILRSYEEDEEIELTVRRADRVITVTGVR